MIKESNPMILGMRNSLVQPELKYLLPVPRYAIFHFNPRNVINISVTDRDRAISTEFWDHLHNTITSTISCLKVDFHPGSIFQMLGPEGPNPRNVINISVTDRDRAISTEFWDHLHNTITSTISCLKVNFHPGSIFQTLGPKGPKCMS